jgi:hypothetical protein
VILVLSVLGFASSTVVSILTTVKLSNHGGCLPEWLLTATWAIILGQTVSIGASHSSVQAHDLGLLAAASCLAASVGVIAQAADAAQSASVPRDADFIVRIVNAVSGVVSVFACLRLPRRPDVYFRNRIVDRQFTYSFLSRYTWTWVQSLLDSATQKGDLTEDDIPEPDHTVRADYLVAAWEKFNFKGSLLKSMFWAYRHSLIYSWTLCVVRVVLGLGPFLTLLRLIKVLECRTPGQSAIGELWPLVVYMGLFTLTEQVRNMSSLAYSSDECRCEARYS